jgi:hypothetical protein
MSLAITLDIEKPCTHKGCKSHVTHPCEGCGRQWSKTDALLDSIEPIKSPMLVSESCKYEDDHNYQYFGHDHNTDYEKCSKCGHIREQ